MTSQPATIEHIRVQAGDSDARSAVAFDDSSWTAVAPDALTSTATWAEVLWYRFHLDVHEPEQPLSLLAGTPIAGQWAVFLNGEVLRTGGGETMDDLLVPWLPSPWRLDPERLRPGHNVVAVRLTAHPLFPTGLALATAQVGEAEAIAAVAADANHRNLIQQAIMLGLLLGVVIYLGGLALNRASRDDATSRSMFVLALVFFAGIAGAGDLPGVLGMNWLWRVGFGMTALLPAALLAFAGQLIAGRKGRAFVIALPIALVLAVGLTLVQDQALGSALFAGALLLHAVAVLYCAWRVARTVRHLDDVWLFALGLLAHFAAVAWVFVRPQDGMNPAIFPGDLGISILVVAGAVAATRRRQRLLDTERLARIEAHDRARERIARDLHDGAGQALTVAKLQAELMARRSDDPEVSAAAQAVAESIAAVGEEFQGAILSLRSSEAALGPGLETLASRARRAGITVHLTVAPEIAAAPRTEEHLLRIAQEAVGNALKHARPSRIDIRFEQANGSACLVILNDGTPLPETVTTSVASMSTMRERAAICGGRFVVERVSVAEPDFPGACTRVLVDGLPAGGGAVS